MRSALVLDSDGMLYGTTFEDTNSPFGKVYRLKTDGSGYTVLKSFNQLSEGSGPRWLVLSGTTLYGTTDSGGDWINGTLFQLNTDGNQFNVLKSFARTNGANPMCLVIDGTMLYGTTLYGGISNCGTIFKINTDGSGFTILKDFNGNDGAEPVNLLLSGTNLFGTTMDGGMSNQGTIFRIQRDGSNFVLLKSFSGPTDGSIPFCDMLAETILYGTSQSGGPLGGGTVFKMNIDGTGFEVIKSFSIFSDLWRAGPGLALSGTTLFGTTMYDTNSPMPGHHHGGTVFKINSDGSNFAVLHRFSPYLNGSAMTNVDGSLPWAPLCLAGTDLFGTTEEGGWLGHGVVFSMSIVPPITLSSPPSQTAEAGSAVQLGVGVSGAWPLMVQWFFNDTNALCDATTNKWLELTNVQPYQSGTYTAAVTNLFGAATSAPAMFNVIPRVERRPVPALNLLGETGSALNLEYADALGSPTNWLPLAMMDLTAAPQLYLDVSVPLPPQRFYRVWQTGTPSAPPSLNLPFLVPAITLTGNIGDQLRLDCINQFGPTDAWVTLGTVTLTNTSQVYFDLSAPGQPRRLYRIVPDP